MPRGEAKANAGTRGGTAWTDGLHSIDGRSPGDGGGSTPEELGVGAGRTGREGSDAIGNATWFAPIEEVSDCPGGVCPVPWAVKEEIPVLQPDTVNHPPHYTDGGIECIEAIESQQTLEEFRGYLKGNIVKYIWREQHKGGTESLKKAQWYLNRLIQLDEVQKG